MDYEQIIAERHGRVGVVRLNRPERLNALTLQLVDELYDALERFNGDPEVGAIVLTGQGRAFCAGLDIEAWEGQVPAQQQEPASYRSQLRWMRIMRDSKPVVVAINGLAVGGGVTMTLSCDVRIASDRAQFQERHVALGLAPDMGSSRLWVQVVGLSHAMRLMLTARRFDAQEAARIGLVTEVVPHDRLMEAALALAAEIACHPASSLRAAKQLVWDHMCESDGDRVLFAEAKVEDDLMEGPDFQEATRAFMEKRPPRFST